MKIITTMKRIVDNRQYEEIDGVLVDMQTANMVITVFNHLNNKNKEIFSNLKLHEMVGIGWELIKRGSKK